MTKRGDIVRLTAEEIRAKRARGEDQTDWLKIEGTTDAELEASIAADPDEGEDEPDWTQAVKGVRR